MLAISSTSLAGITEIDNPSLKELLERGITVIDVRREDEWRATGIVEGSYGLTFFDEKGRYDANAWLSELSNLIEKNESFVLISARGARSSKIASFLDKRMEFERVHNVTFGIYDWIKKNHSVVAWQAGS